MRRTTAIAALSAVALLAGCSSSRMTASPGAFRSEPTVLSLGAGDSLGRAVYVNDLILAAAAVDKNTTYTNIDSGASDVLFDPRY